MRVEVKFLTEPQLVNDCGRWTSGHDRSSRLVSDYVLKKYIESEHSPIRALLLMIDLYEVPVPVSVHLVRHKVGVEHFVTSNRPDRTGKERTAYDSVNHRLLLNYQALRNLCKERLCHNAEAATRNTVVAIKGAVAEEAITRFGLLLGGALDSGLVPKCQYRGGVCHEFKCCGKYVHAFAEDSLP